MTALRERWSAFSPRERLLIGVAGGLVVLLLLSVLVFRPLANIRASGEAAFADASQTRATVAQAVGSGASDGPVSTGPLRGIVSDTADAAGVVIDRYDIQDGAVDLTIGEIDAPTLYAWLGALSDQHGIVVREATVRRDGEGSISARLTLTRRG